METPPKVTPVGDRVIPNDKLELTSAELAAAEAQESVAPDPAPDPAPEAEGFIALTIGGLVQALAAVSGPAVKWPDTDVGAPDYRHLSASTLAIDSTFTLTPDDIELLIEANRFQPQGKDNVIALAFRGLALGKQSEVGTKHEVELAKEVEVTEVRPDHVNYRCVLGFYLRDPDRTKRRLTLFSGSTVPNPKYMRNYFDKVKAGRPIDIACNMLPTGCYVFRVGAHQGGTIKPALRMTDPDNLSADATCTVLRTTNDLTFGTNDVWDTAMPFDNVHCTYVTSKHASWGAFFSSAGCLTVRGKSAPSDQWAKFQAVLNKLGPGKRCDLVLLTGREAAVAAKLRTTGAAADDAVVRRELVRLRPGSQSSEVDKLRQKLGLSAGEYFGPVTKRKLAEKQKEINEPTDGVYSPALQQQLGWAVL